MIVPESVRSALGNEPARTSIGVRMPVSRGQVRRIRHSAAMEVPEFETPERMVLVLRVDSQRDFSEIVLVHPYLELATSLDLVVPPERSNMPYPIVIQTDTRAVVSTYQLEMLVGELHSEALVAFGEAAVGNPVQRQILHTGMSLRGPLDPRWDFKAREGDVIRRMASDCTSALLDDEPPVQLDISSLPDELPAASDEFISMLANSVGIQTTNIVDIDFGVLAALEAEGALSVDSWNRIHALTDHDLYESVWPLFEKALSTVSLS